MRSCDRPRKRSVRDAVPSSDSKRYSLSIRTQGSSCRCRASSSPRRVSSFSALSSSSLAASHSLRVPVLWSVIVFSPGCGRSWPLAFRTSHGADLPARSAAAIEQVCPVGLEPADAGAARHLQPTEHGAALPVDLADFALVAFPGGVPQLAVDPGHAGDEAVGLDGAQNGASRGIDLVDLAIAVLPHPQAALGPGESRVAAVAGRRDRCQYVAGGGIDLVDARCGDLVEVRAVEGGAGVAGALERARELAALGIEGDQLRSGGGPDAMAVVGDAVDAVGAGEGAILTHDLGCARRCLRFRLVYPASGAGHRLAPCGALRNGAARPIYPGGSAAGSNKIVVNPASGGDSQRCARARPMERTRPAASNSTTARWTVRWLPRRASARAEVDQAAPSASSARSDA